MMRFNNRWTGIIAVCMAVSAMACSGAKTAPAGQANAELEALYRARTDSARNRFVEADVRFMTNMIGHHAQAIVMSRLAPTHDASPSIRTLAARIINAQQDEITLMQQWLKDRGQKVPEVHIEGTTLMVHNVDHAAHMAGMLTPEQLKQLDQARGIEFDRLFLTFMIAHHRGAVSMVTELFNSFGGGQEDVSFKLASDVQIDQVTEIERMQQMLAALPARK